MRNSQLTFSPQEFIEDLKKRGINRFYFVYDSQTKKLKASHLELADLAKDIENKIADFNEHEGMFFQLGEHDILHGAFIHQTQRGQAQGGTRFWKYDTLFDYLLDGIRLSQGMTYKNALAGIWWGGGKGVICSNPLIDTNDPSVRNEIFKEYGKFTSSLNGAYVTAKDVGTTTKDIESIFSQTRFITCIENIKGGSGDPSRPTALGVVRAMEAALEFKNEGTLEGKTIAIQGGGSVAQYLTGFLLEKNVKKLLISDINVEKIEYLQQKFQTSKIQFFVHEPHNSEILFQECDILAPCAIGGVLNSETIAKIKAKMICGAANNQLQDEKSDALLLHQKGITYIPDFLVNRMGIVHCANEQYGYVNNDIELKKHLEKNWDQSIYKLTLYVLNVAQDKNITTTESAIEIAQKLAKEKHPIFKHRTIEIIKSLVNLRWELQTPKSTETHQHNQPPTKRKQLSSISSNRSSDLFPRIH